jgi:hypothetical protein
MVLELFLLKQIKQIEYSPWTLDGPWILDIETNGGYVDKKQVIVEP